MSKLVQSKIKTFASTFVIILSLDQWTKHLIHSKFVWGQSTSLIPNIFSLTYVRNQGAAFGFLHHAPTWFREPFFLIMPLIVMIFILFLFVRVDTDHIYWKLWNFGYSLILTGAVGNLIDRSRLGYVIDFLDFHWKEIYHYPAFNVADSAIVVGVGLLLMLTFLDEKRRKSQPKA
ncbi:MAG: signal peptidase II [Deltaproteobacteria bacterium]|nr:signal peptidase II [Deltaproteobacteria bacterium]MBI3294126.1 signal peptidase II [Deltaproteobacteria bacterium]